MTELYFLVLESHETKVLFSCCFAEVCRGGETDGVCGRENERAGEGRKGKEEIMEIEERNTEEGVFLYTSVTEKILEEIKRLREGRDGEVEGRER